MDEVNDKDFELPRHGTDEECYDEYQEEVDPQSGSVVRHDVEESPEIETGALPGYASKDGQNFSLSLASQQAQVQTYFAEGGRRQTKIRAYKSSWVHNLIHLEGKKFDFTGRNYLHPIYNSSAKNILLKTARQVEKCLASRQKLLIKDRGFIFADKVKKGDFILDYAVSSKKTVFTEVEGSESNGVKQCLNIYLDTYNYIEVTLNHPFWTHSGWMSAERLSISTQLFHARLGWVDIYKIEMGETQETWAIQTKSKTFLVDNIYTHNSTFLANNLSIMCAIQPFYRCLYVSPSHVQTRTFSNDKLKPVLERSPLIARYLQDNKVSTQVFEKGFTNGSFIFLRSAFFSADRARGISSNLLCYDRNAFLLTRLGWKRVYEVTQEDELATRNPDTSALEWHKPYRIIKKKHTGKMITFVHEDNFYLRVTGNHNMVATHNLFGKEPSWKLITALELLNKESRFKMGVPIQDEKFKNSKEFIFGGNNLKVGEVVDEEVYCVTVKNHQIVVKGNPWSHPVVSGNCIDEVQDMIMGNIPVIAQCLSHAENPVQLFAGTPKSYDNTIQQVWETTSQNEWMVRCTGCNRDNYLDIKNIGKRGPICKRCGKDLDVTNGRWMKAKVNTMWEGFRIPQLMVPWIARKGSDSWKSLVYQMETYPESQFYNEVLGISFDNAAKPVTRADILDCCSDKVPWVTDPFSMSEELKRRVSKMTLFAGIDWGEGNDGTGKDVMGKIRTASYTVMTIGGFVGGGRFRVIYCKRYTGKETDPDFIIKDILRTCRAMGVKMIGADWGHGWGMNNKLVRSFGPNRFAQFMYVDSQKEVRKWDAVGFKFQLMRNHVMSELFFWFKEGLFEFPNLDLWEHFAQDMLNISVEYIEYQRKLRYVHRPSDPDDWFHSLVYCKQIADVYHGKM